MLLAFQRIHSVTTNSVINLLVNIANTFTLYHRGINTSSIHYFFYASYIGEAYCLFRLLYLKHKRSINFQNKTSALAEHAHAHVQVHAVASLSE